MENPLHCTGVIFPFSRNENMKYNFLRLCQHNALYLYSVGGVTIRCAKIEE